jgi:hypothetical protein
VEEYISMSDFNINFGNAREMVLPEEGTYTLVISDYQVKQAKNEDSRTKGFNIALTFQFANPPAGADNFRIYHNLWCSYENPWAAKIFFEALTGKELTDTSLDVTDPDLFLGEKVGAALIHESYTANDGATKTKMAVASAQAFFPAD